MSLEAAKKIIPEGKYVDIGDGLSIHYQDEGRGEPVVFFHGSGPGASGYSNFKRNYPYLAERGFRTIVPDTLGFGYSSKPEGVDYGMDFVAGAMVRFLDKLGLDKVTLVGNSHGGALAIKLALDHPHRVSKLVLMAAGGLEEREVYMKMEGIRTMMKVFLAPEGITREGMRTVFSHQLYDVSQLTEEILDERMAIAPSQPKRVLTSLAVPHLTPRLKELACPVLGFWGVNDKFCPVSGAQAIATEVAKARVITLSHCGHWVMVEYPDLFNRMTLDFLARG
jgi:4,5:9,10-diseco-3-hydroxy-5,9,17-trioxoandrosta-1(10),2-diene-4-oate hydrolase